MITNLNDLNNYLTTLRKGDYQRFNFDNFLEKVKFEYNIPSVHISGTNGKGSVGNYLKNIYLAKGYNVGYFHSPYYKSMLEMILLNNEAIKFDYIDKIISKYDKYIKKFDLSEFELETFIALNYFKDNNVDIAIVECGMGGEDDATNIFIPKLSIITSVSLEHTMFLGSSITEIAKAKSGIIKSEVDVVIGKLNEEATQVIYQVALQNKSIVYQVDNYFNERLTDDGYMFDTIKYHDLLIKSFAKYSIEDAMIALKAIEILNKILPVDEESIKEGLNKSQLLGRMTIINKSPLSIVDGAHNPEAIISLCESINALNKENLKIHVIFAAFLDKNIQNMLSSLNFISNDIYLTTFPHIRARKEEDYLLYLQDYSYQENPLVLYEKLKNDFPNDLILICGSLAFAFYMIDKTRG